MSVVTKRHDCVAGDCSWCQADRAWLQADTRPPASRTGRFVRVVDLFCGCGGLTLGLQEAARRLGLRTSVRLAIDSDLDVLQIYRRNFPRAIAREGLVDTIFDGTLGAKPTRTESVWSQKLTNLDVLLGGPPCQGHSDLNNHTRRNDPKNALYQRMARAAELLKPKIVLVENVVPARRDRSNVVDVTKVALETCGYKVAYGVVDLRAVGVPQSRRRLLMIATTLPQVQPADLLARLGRLDPGHPARTVRWAIEDLSGITSSTIFDTASRPTKRNADRIQYLLDNKLQDLPNSERPSCHQKDHSYVSMYGRLHWDEPAQTITTGFGCMGQGRFVHPAEGRTLTPHEAARIQAFPDWFDFGTDLRRGVLAKAIGNAVPPFLTLQLGLILLPHLRAT